MIDFVYKSFCVHKFENKICQSEVYPYRSSLFLHCLMQRKNIPTLINGHLAQQWSGRAVPTPLPRGEDDLRLSTRLRHNVSVSRSQEKNAARCAFLPQTISTRYISLRPGPPLQSRVSLPFSTMQPFSSIVFCCTSETLIYLIPPKILLLNLLKRSILSGGSESSKNNLPIYLHTYLFQSSITLFLISPEYLVDVSPILLALLATAGG